MACWFPLISYFVLKEEYRINGVGNSHPKHYVKQPYMWARLFLASFWVIACAIIFYF